MAAKVVYFHLVDERVEEKVEKLSEHYSRPQLNVLKRTLVRMMCKSHNITIQFVENVINYASQNGSRVAHEALAVKYILYITAEQLKELLKLKPLTDENYNKRIREDIENVANEEAVNDMAANDNDGHENECAVDEWIIKQRRRFDRNVDAQETTELKITITAVYGRLRLGQANIFFDICHDLIEQCSNDIKSKLGKTIPVRSYISTIFMMLEHEETGSDRKLQISEIKNEFENTYAPIKGRKNIEVCMKCSGQKCPK